MTSRYPVYVISKGRHDRCITARSLRSIGQPFTLVVEPTEERAYRDAMPWATIAVLPFHDLGQGSIPARNWVWDHSVAIGADRHWIMDDNIDGFYRLNRNEKWVVRSPATIRASEDFTDRYSNVALSGMNYNGLVKAHSGVPAFRLNTRVYSCILIRNDVPFRWRGRYNEDTDLSLRALKAGYCTVLFNAFLCGKITTMRMKGGNTDTLYSGDGRMAMAQSLVEQHPDVASVTWKFGRWQHHVNYDAFKGNKLEKAQVDHPIGTCEYGMKLVPTRLSPNDRTVHHVQEEAGYGDEAGD